MNKFKLCILFGFGCFLGCSSNTQMAPLPLPVEALSSALIAAKTGYYIDNNDSSEDWWSIFNDPQLSHFLLKAFCLNPNLESARQRIITAEYTADRVRAALYPQFNLASDASRQKLSKTGVIPFRTTPTNTIVVPAIPGEQTGIPQYFSLYEAQINLRFNFDFWSKNRNTLKAALSQVEAARAEAIFAKLELGIDLAKVYFELQTVYKRLEVALQLVANRQKYLDLVKKRIKANIDTQLSLQAADANLSEAKDHLLYVQGEIAVLENQLRAYMADNFMEEIHVIQIESTPLPAVPMPVDLPLRLISKRPDITAQLWLIESAGKQIEVAKAGFYPDFNLNAFFGYQTIHFAELFKWPSAYFDIAPAFTLPIFDGGILAANLGYSEVNFDIAVLEYNQLIIRAAQEVLDSLAVLNNSWQRLEEYSKKTGYQKELYNLTKLRVRHNLSNSLDELISQEIFLRTQEQEAQSLGNTYSAILNLIKSIGGGYDTCPSIDCNTCEL